ncbi:MAG: glycosyltransferase [Xanthomonadales bacterium]|nr:glycosyltransferase [Gammaproteobacteria bacterium]NNE05638.1 glycosyltransferase [Xanthomonadales bacterium]NNL95561.1 glycosyltransferase [Xanthomonadales bacterium]
MKLPGIVIPVFNAHEDVQACLASVQAHSPAAEVLVIDDASSDARVAPMLKAWQDSATRRRVITHDRNQGFVRSANRGMQQFDGDIVLLNSDTLVTPGWLEALSDCLASDPAIATATPWTNNGEIASFPDLCVAAPVPENLERFAAAIAQGGQPVYPEIPTAVGFCMAISGRALKAVGEFDAELFGRGYGEENDFSLRAKAAGFRNVLCDNAYVAHIGGRSFKSVNMAPGPESMDRLLSRHPDYQQLIAEFIEADPLADRRLQLARAVQAVAA